MTARLYDAHVHLADPKLRPYLKEIGECYEAINLCGAVVNGTNPQDWPAVLECSASDRRLIPAIGLHPWQVPYAPENWQELFLEAFEAGAQVVGEIGLDRWIDGHNLAAQIPVFEFQLQFAATNNLPVSIHALKATGPLMDILRAAALPVRGFHLHAYNGPVELIKELTRLGAYFSFNAGQIKKHASLECLRAIPHERLLIETDAPDFLPSPPYREYQLPNPDHNHPANLKQGYGAIAELIDVQAATLADVVEENFRAFFLNAD